MIVFTDLHIHNYAQFDTNGSRLENCLAVLDLMFQEASRSDQIILFAGDLFDAHKAVPIKVLTGATARFNALFQKYPAVKFIAISGNHDMGAVNIYGREPVTALAYLAEVFPSFYLIDNGHIDLNGYRIHGLPYYDYSADFIEALRELELAERNILLIHQTPAGTDLPIHHDFELGSLFSPFEYVFCGHIHKRFELSDNFTIVGTPLHRDFGDEGQEKGYYIYPDYDFVEPKLRWVSTRGLWPEFGREGQADYIRPTIAIIAEASEELNYTFDGDVASQLEAYLRETNNFSYELFKTGLELCK